MSDGVGFTSRAVASKARGLELEDRMFVREQRARKPPVSWQAIAGMLQCSIDLVRRECDPDYVSTTPPAGDGLPVQARGSGRTARGGTAWAEPGPAREPAAVPSAVFTPTPRPAPPIVQDPGRFVASETKAARAPTAAVPASRHAPPAPPPSERPPGLSADLIAQAVVIAARAYGDDPVVAMTSGMRSRRRCLAAAAEGLAMGLGVSRTIGAAAVGIQPATVHNAKSLGGSAFKTAARNVEDCVRWNLGATGAGA